MTRHEKESIRNALSPQHPAVITTALSPEPGAVDDRMTKFCDQLKTIAPHVRIKKDSDTTFEKPALITGAHNNIAYQAIPEGKILERFIDALAQTSTVMEPIDSGLDTQLAQIELPVALKLYVAAQCPHCPKTLQQLQALAGASSKIRLTVIDAALFSKSAQTDGVKAVPTVILDDQFRWSGQMDLQELLTICIERDPAQLSPGSLRQLIEEGAAEMVAQMMIDYGKHFPALIDLLAHERWSVRLGAMVTVEYLAEADPELASDLVAPLWKRITNASEQTQGDMVHVLGQIPTPASRKYLQRIVTGAFEQSVVEAAEEALNEMDQA